jgi:hypothetical protein
MATSSRPVAPAPAADAAPDASPHAPHAAPDGAPAGKRALLVGIDRYRHVGQLEGCVNDVRLMGALLVDAFGFPPAQVTTLVDEAATRDGILAALDRLVADTRPDDVVVFHYAGHGSQMTDREGDEASGMDNTLVPVDSGRDFSAGGGERAENRDVTDDELAVRLAALAERTPYVTLVVDACHSGTITRDLGGPTFGVRSRGVEPDTRPASALPPSPLPAAARTRSRGARDEAGGGGLAPRADGYVLIAGCRDEERSYEYRAPEAAGGAPVAHGALTYFLAQELRALAPGATYRDVFERAAARVTAANREQHPQIEGRLDREVFGVRDARPMRFVRVLAADADRVTLATGAALGATVGSRYAVYAQGTKSTEGVTPSGVVEVVAVGAVTSEARVLAGAGAIAADARAVETAHADADRRLRVQLVADGGVDGGREDALAPLRTALSDSPLVAVVGEGEAASVRVYLLAPRAAAGPADPVPQLGALASPAWAVVGDDGQLLAPPKAPADANAVRENLETLARYRRALALANPDPASALRGRVTVELLRRLPDKTWAVAEPGAGGMTAFEEGERIGFRLTSAHDAPVYVNLVDFGPTGRIALVHPPAGAQEALAPGVTLDLVGRAPGRRGWPIEWPKGFPFAAGEGAAPAAEGVETVRLFVTTAPADFTFLSQAGVRALAALPAARGRASELELLMRTATGAATRDLGDDAEDAPPPEDWATAERTFLIRRRRQAALSADGAAVTVGGATLRTPGLTGTASAAPGARPEVGTPVAATAGSAEPPAADPLAQALGASGATVRQTLAVDAAPAGGPGARAAGPAAVDVTVADPGPDLGQLLVSTDALGVVSFHFAPAGGAGGGARDALSPNAARTFRVPVRPGSGAAAGGAPGETSGTPGARVIGVPSVARLVLKHVVFPLVDPLVGAVSESFAGRWEAAHRPYRLRPFGPDDHARDDVPPLDGADWERLGRGRALLFVHGTFSRAHSAFGGLPRDVVGALHARYEGRVFAFDHHTLSDDPADNVRWLVDHLPDGARLDVDVVCHSRGGLVSRVLAERQGELALGGRAVRVGKVVFVGAPNAGTALADPDRMGALIDTYATVLNLIPEPATKEVLQAVVTVAKQLAVGAAKGLPGLQAMRPDGAFAKRLNAGARAGDTRYFALTSDYTPRHAGLKRLLADRLMDGIFKGGNDLVVPSEGVWSANGSGFFPIDEKRVLSDGESVAHTEFFTSPGAQRQMLEWLTAA